MSVSDSAQSSDNNENTESNTINTAPPLSKQSGHPNENAHGYFIPVVITIVFGIVVISTFGAKELNTQVTGSVSPDKAAALTSETADGSIAITEASAGTDNTVKTPAIAETVAGNLRTSEMASTVTETTESDSTLITADTSSTATTEEQALSPEISKLDTRQYPPYDGRHNQMAYGLPEHYPTNYMWEQRRRSYEDAIRTRREHMIKMKETRAAELKRLEQVRLGRYKRMQDLEMQSRIRRNQLMQRMEQEKRIAVNRPI